MAPEQSPSGPAAPSARLQPLCSPAAFDAVLSRRPVARTEHFLLHHRPSADPAPERNATKLSTGQTLMETGSVDEWLGWSGGFVVPKRHARRSVTRTLIRRQMRVALDPARSALPPGDWVVRLRQPFDPKQFPSAASDALRRAVRTELEQLVAQARRRVSAEPAPAGGAA